MVEIQVTEKSQAKKCQIPKHEFADQLGLNLTSLDSEMPMTKPKHCH